MSKRLVFVLIILLVISNAERINNAVYGVSEISYDVVKSDIDKITNNITETRTAIKTTTKYDLFTNKPSLKQEVISQEKNEYHIKTKAEIVNEIKISNDDYVLDPVIRNALLDTDINTLNNISKVIVRSHESVMKECNAVVEKALGCYDPNNYYIYASELTAYSSDASSSYSYCNTFENTLYHEIGHANYLSYNNYINYSNIQYENRPDEIFAKEYANQHSKDKCSSDKYIELKNRLNSTEKIVASTELQLAYWNRYGAAIPSDIYDAYMRDYNANLKAIRDYNNIVNQIDEYLINTVITTRI